MSLFRGVVFRSGARPYVFRTYYRANACSKPGRSTTGGDRSGSRILSRVRDIVFRRFDTISGGTHDGLPTVPSPPCCVRRRWTAETFAENAPRSIRFAHRFPSRSRRQPRSTAAIITRAGRQTRSRSRWWLTRYRATAPATRVNAQRTRVHHLIGNSGYNVVRHCCLKKSGETIATYACSWSGTVVSRKPNLARPFWTSHAFYPRIKIDMSLT